ncbi:3-hydroxyisobutyrate dehydrogenase [Psychrobacter cryohalolentis]|uniref:3-hydroxyisobutyrate dehydrogenase n=2 Tax=Psychrobacter cryohalolentis TaxID=330922 RepID=Q1QAL1_PSYCK|nr:3-hydroxyisobutyrate dehydrogenase [Psychrobacter cryohalolentis]ABE75292.1 3-hydroxyisobutyrate dehydrogenase [Psychrobacter cryohalolentis K5]ASE25485.1 3-hydroxyisobutyrate dehydrogenase [Psychrobacter cryohalolentis]
MATKDTGSSSTTTTDNDGNTAKPNIAFIGLGNMGGPMAANLLKAGYTLSVYDLSVEATARLQQAGANIAESPKDAAQNAQVIISMLPAGKHVHSVYLGEGSSDGLLVDLPKGTLVIDSSTIAAADARKVAEVASKLGIDFLDAPVSGGTGGAIAGTLTFIVGGDDAAFAKAEPILAVMGKNIFHAGEHGAGQVAKICNNMLLGILMAGTAEAINLGVKNGLDPKVLSDIMLQSSGRNWTLEVYNPYPQVMENVPSSNGYQGGFMSKLMQKDLNLAMQTAQDTHVETPMGAKATELYAAHTIENGDRDFSSIMARHDSSVLS